jgi:hypothetical protein
VGVDLYRGQASDERNRPLAPHADGEGRRNSDLVEREGRLAPAD